MPAVSDVLRQLLLWLPNLVVALVVLVIGGLLANAASSLVKGATAEAGFDNPDTLARVAWVGVWCFAIVIAVNQIGIAATLVNTLFMGVVGAVSIAAAIAFGWGGHGVAEELVRKWYGKGKAAAPKIASAADDAAERSPSRNASADSGAHPRDLPAGAVHQVHPTVLRIAQVREEWLSQVSHRRGQLFLSLSVLRTHRHHGIAVPSPGAGGRRLGTGYVCMPSRDHALELRWGVLEQRPAIGSHVLDVEDVGGHGVMI